MKVEARLFHIITVFFLIASVVYGVWSKEPVGTVALILTGGLSLIVGSYFSFVARRVARRPEDNTEAEVSDGAGEVGFFSAGSYWPVAIAASGGVTAVAIAFWQIWLLVVGLVLILSAVAGLVFEYHTRPNVTD